MNNLGFYEKIPNDAFPIRVLDFPNSNYEFSAHWHEHLEFHFVRRGSGKIKLGEKTINVFERGTVIANSNEMHQAISGNISYICMILPPEFLLDNHVIFESSFVDENVWKYVDEIYKLENDFSSVNALAIKGQVCLLLKYLIENHTENFLDETIYQNKIKKLSIVNNTIKYINDKYFENISTKILADRIHLSEGYFCSVFKSATGISANQYIMNVRIKKAKSLLTYSDMNITEIANLCGFSDSNYFSRAFKKNVDLTPKEYRNKYKLK